MGSGYEVEVTITSAKDLKNINWRYGPLKPYAVVWVDPKFKSSTHVGFNNHVERKLNLKRPSGRPHGKVEIKVNVHEVRYPPHGAYPPPPSWGGSTGGPYGGYGAPYGASVSGYPPQPYGQGQGGYYGQASYGQGYEEKKSSNKFGGMGTGLAVGAAAGLLGGLAIAEGADYVEDKIADDAADKVEEDLGYDDDDF